MHAAQAHWETVYQSKAFNAVSWYAPHLDESLTLIEQLAPDRQSAIVDIGGGESTLVDDLLHRGYERPCVLDISAHAVSFTQARLGPQLAQSVDWHVGDVTNYPFGLKQFDLWHDRAVFHFLTDAKQRQQYVQQVRKHVKPGGYVVMATFGPDGPLQCSGLEVVRYGRDELHAQFGKGFRLDGSVVQDHATPFGTHQQFLYCWCRVAAL